MKGSKLSMSQHFTLTDTTINDLVVLERKPIKDNRGLFERLFCQDELSGALQGKSIAQINHTLTKKAGAVRGMHFQYPPCAEIKYVSCLKGEVFDVAVDLRKNSSTFLRWHAEVLSADNFKMFVIPEGFAHGFQTLTEDCEMYYFHTAAYAAEAECALNALDPRLNITWPKLITEQSERDQAHPMLRDDFDGVAL
jgi:dTDP-4-dehydrorhamnose 3,5-epimerase